MIDAHHHIWRQHDLPWLLGPEQPRIFGEYEAIKRDYLINEYLGDIKHTPIERSVYVQANWSPNWAVDEARWVQSVADDTGWPDAIVAYADFTSGNIDVQLERLQQVPLVRGIRQQLHWHTAPQYCFAKRPDLGSDPVFQRNINRLVDYGWCFDLQIFPSQAEHAVALANACPEVAFIVQHAGMLEDFTDTGWARWRRSMEAMANCSNIAVKLSGLGTFTRNLNKPLIQQTVSETLQTFGIDRCMYGSNFPIEKLWTSYDDLFRTLQEVTSHLSESDVNAIFNDNAERYYRLDKP